MNDCCKAKLDELIKRMVYKFCPLIYDYDENNTMSPEQFGMLRALLWVAHEAEFMRKESVGE